MNNCAVRNRAPKVACLSAIQNRVTRILRITSPHCYWTRNAIKEIFYTCILLHFFLNTSATPSWYALIMRERTKLFVKIRAHELQWEIQNVHINFIVQIQMKLKLEKYFRSFRERQMFSQKVEITVSTLEDQKIINSDIQLPMLIEFKSFKDRRARKCQKHRRNHIENLPIH
jgi:hypothetical protein